LDERSNKKSTAGSIGFKHKYVPKML